MMTYAFFFSLDFCCYKQSNKEYPYLCLFVLVSEQFFREGQIPQSLQLRCCHVEAGTQSVISLEEGSFCVTVFLLFRGLPDLGQSRFWFTRKTQSQGLLPTSGNAVLLWGTPLLPACLREGDTVMISENSPCCSKETPLTDWLLYQTLTHSFCAVSSLVEHPLGGDATVCPNVSFRTRAK